MKNNTITIIAAWGLLAILLPVIRSLGQGNMNALYLTEEDFKNNYLTHPAVTDSDNRIEQELGNKLWVYREGRKTKFKFGTVYGYYQDGTTYRAWQRKKIFSDYGFYRVLDDSGLTIYARRSSHHRSHGYPWYYYSLTATGNIKRLTAKNIRMDFLSYPGFVDAVVRIIDKKQEGDKAGEKLLINEYYTTLVKSNSPIEINR